MCWRESECVGEEGRVSVGEEERVCGRESECVGERVSVWKRE